MLRRRLVLFMGATLFAATFPAAASVSILAQSEKAPPGHPEPMRKDDPFGLEVTLQPKTVIYMKGTGNWDSAFDTLVDAFKAVKGYLDKRGLKPAGPAMTIYTDTDDTGFSFQAAIPIAEPPKDPPQGDIALGQTPEGRALEFTHRGSYDSMDTTYEAITNFLDDKRIDAKEMFIEEYLTDPTTTSPEQMVVHVFVPIK